MSFVATPPEMLPSAPSVANGWYLMSEEGAR
jgi:hypothetical protein